VKRGLLASLATTTIAVCILATTACSEMSNPTYDLVHVGCQGTTDSAVHVLQQRVTADGQLRNAHQVTTGDRTFVSAELHRRSEDPHSKGDILTWVTNDIASGRFLSVDVNARDDSAWPHATLDVTAPGARESRGCVVPTRGKTPAQLR
jgi:hypothetical protein